MLFLKDKNTNRGTLRGTFIAREIDRRDFDCYKVYLLLRKRLYWKPLRVTLLSGLGFRQHF